MRAHKGTFNGDFQGNFKGNITGTTKGDFKRHSKKKAPPGELTGDFKLDFERDFKKEFKGEEESCRGSIPKIVLGMDWITKSFQEFLAVFHCGIFYGQTQMFAKIHNILHIM